MKTRNSIATLAVFAATTLVVAACGGGGDDDQPDYPMNNAPTISAITDKSADQDNTVTVEFTVADQESAADSLTVEAVADGTGLFPTDGMVLSGSGATRTLTLTPFEATTGTARIEVRVTDPQGSATAGNFQVTVNARNVSLKSMTLETFAKSESDMPTTINGWTIEQDAEDPAAFAALIPAGDE
jgi:Bacterial Ig domain